MGVGDGGRGHNGGVWEWTSTVFDKHKGFKPSTLYPGFSADFFDTLHNVVVCDILSMVLFFIATRTHESQLKDWWVLRHDPPSSGTTHAA